MRKLDHRSVGRLGLIFLGLAALLLLSQVSPSIWSASTALALVALVALALSTTAEKRAAVPSLIVAGVITLSGTGGYLLWGHLNTAGGVSAQIGLSDQARIVSLNVHAMSALSILLATALLAGDGRHSEAHLNAHKPTRARFNRRTTTLLATLAALPVVISISGMGLGNYLDRTGYLEYPGGIDTLMRVSGSFLFVGAAAASALTFAERRVHRFVGYLAMTMISTITISQGSRRLAALPLLFLAGRTAAGARPRLGSLMISLAASLYLMQLPLVFRGLSRHGLLPHLRSLSNYLVTELPWNPILANLLFGFPVTAQVASVEQRLPHSFFWISVNPLPGTVVGWYEIADRLRLNTYTPFSALGELANYGALYLVSYSICLGSILTVAARTLNNRISKTQGPAPIQRLLLVAISGYIGLTLVQYNLRNGARLVYLILAIALAVGFSDRLRYRKL